MKNRFLMFLVFIVILGAVLRFFNLGSLPPSLNWDEVSHGYNAYSILKTGADEWGKSFPVTNFRAYGDYPLPLNLYLTIPFVSLFGLTEISIRLPNAILGVLTIISTYFFVSGLTKKKEMGLLASLLVAVDPWTLFTSRFVLQSNVSIFFLVTAAALFFNRQKKWWFLPLSIVSLGLTLYSYHTTRIVSPLILIAIAIIYWKDLFQAFRKDGKKFWINVVLVVVFFLPLPFILGNPEARARSGVVFILNDSAVDKIISLRQKSNLPGGLSRLVYNRPTYFVWNFVDNYLDYFSPEFLFLKGGTQYQFSIPDRGIVLLAALPFFYIGLVWLVKKFGHERQYQVVLAWLFLAPIPASITVDRFAVLRATSMIPLVELVSVIGFFALLEFLSRKKNGNLIRGFLIASFFIVLAWNLEDYMSDYIGSYTKNYSWSWQYGYKAVVNYAKDNYSKYDKIIVTKKYGEPHEYFLFYLGYDPGKYKSDLNLVRFGQSNWFWVDRFDKFYFVNDWQVKELVTESKIKIDCRNVRCLLITSPGNSPKNWNKIDKVDFLDGKPAFEIYEN